jgi:hypothetical protein
MAAGRRNLNITNLHARLLEDKKSANLDLSRSSIGVNVTPNGELSESSSELDESDDDAPTPLSSADKLRFAVKQKLEQNFGKSEQDTEQKTSIESISFNVDPDEYTLADLKNLIDAGNYAELSEVLRRSIITDDSKPQKFFDIMEENERKELLAYYISNNNKTYYSILLHCIGAYVSEFFYIYWNLESCIEIMTALLPFLSENEWTGINESFLPFVALANITFNPMDEARDYMRNKMLDPNQAILKVINNNKILALAFALYAFGGAYIDVEDLNTPLKDKIGLGRIGPMGALVYSAVVYYFVMQFIDTKQGILKWKNSKSIFAESINFKNKLSISDRITNVYCMFHQSLAFGERGLRLAYGGWSAGNQQFGDEPYGNIIANSIGAAVGAGTIPVALGTRIIPTLKMYDPDVAGITPEEYAEAKKKYDENYWKYRFISPVIAEAKLMLFSPTIFLTVIPAAFAAAYLPTPYLPDVAPYAYAGTTALLTHTLGCMRFPAQRRAIIQIAEEDKPLAIDEIRPNKGTKVLAFVSNTIDQGTRVLDAVYMLSRLAQSSFDITKLSGKLCVITALALESYLSTSALRYQAEKSGRAIAGLGKSLLGRYDIFAQKPKAPVSEEKNAPAPPRSWYRSFC